MDAFPHRHHAAADQLPTQSTALLQQPSSLQGGTNKNKLRCAALRTPTSKYTRRDNNNNNNNNNKQQHYYLQQLLVLG
jgi:hypothetical protein